MNLLVHEVEDITCQILHLSQNIPRSEGGGVTPSARHHDHQEESHAMWSGI